MQARDLIGHLAIRTKPTSYGDHSYTDSPLRILAVTENHIACGYPKESVFAHILGNKPHILDYRWLDDNWTDYDELMRLADKTAGNITPVSSALN